MRHPVLSRPNYRPGDNPPTAKLPLYLYQAIRFWLRQPIMQEAHRVTVQIQGEKDEIRGCILEKVVYTTD
jgi:hypothetical protein